MFKKMTRKEKTSNGFSCNGEALDRILRLPEVKHISGLPKCSIYHLKSIGLFPDCVKIGPRAVGWSEKSIRDWVNQHLSALKSEENNHE